MRITARLQAAAWLPAGVAVVTGLGLVWSLQEAARREQDRTVARKVEASVYDLTELARDYIAHHDRRPREQFGLVYEDLDRTLSAAGFSGPEQAATVRSLRELARMIAGMFDHMVAAAQYFSWPEDAALLREVEDRLAGQIIIRSRTAQADAERLRASAIRASAVAQRRLALLIVGLLVALTLALTPVLLLMTRSVTRSLGRFRQGVETVGSGDLAHRIASLDKDELGELARAFDRMTGRLQSTIVSHDALAAEVEQRKQAEQRLRDTADALARSNAELEEFASVASHDLQEPLRMVRSYVGLIEERYRDRLDEKATHYIRYAVDGAKRMQEMIDSLLDLSRVHTRGRPAETLDTSACVAEAQENLKEHLTRAGAEIRVGPLPRVLGDRTQLVHVFQNLIDNALKFRGEADVLVEVSAADRGAEWEFAVRDNGIGIKPAHTGKIFRMFQRLHAGEEYPGTGMGLAICRRVIERHGGRIWVEPAPAGGSVFRFTLSKVPPFAERKGDNP